MCYKVFALCFVFVCFAPVCLCIGEDIGEICVMEFYGEGICRNISECAFAKKLLYEDEKHPPMCKWEDRTRIVCCPTKNQIHVTGAFGRMYQGIDEGVKRSRKVICHYNGNEPLICCPNVVEAELPEEKGCPAIEIPEVTPSPTNIAWKKCAEYQRYVHRCVVSDDNPDKLIRKYRCDIPDKGFRISAGKTADDNEFSHMALIGCEDQTTVGLGVQWLGGGALISDKFVLTAAHVLVGEKSPVRYVMLGTRNKTDTINGSLYNIVYKIYHPNYQLHLKYYDIALAELHKRVRLSEFIRPACLPSPEITIEKAQNRIIAGWGRTAENADPSILLLTAEVYVLNNHSQCNKLAAGHFEYQSSSMICAAGTNNINSSAADTCRGDSGGPLMALVTNLNCSYSVEGIVSFGPHCGIGAAAVYTRVSSYLDWIVKNVWPDEAKKSRN